MALCLCLCALYRKHLEDLETGGMAAFLSGIKGKRDGPISKILSKKQNEEDASVEKEHTHNKLISMYEKLTARQVIRWITPWAI